MDFHGVELICPACRADLTRMPTEHSTTSSARVDEQLVCVSCARAYPVLLGIPDLRLWPDPYIGIEEDRAKALMLAEECRGLDFVASVELYYRVTSVVPAFQARRFARSLLAAADRSDAMLRAMERRAGSGMAHDLLDVGCGTAPLLVTATQRYRHFAGVDVAFRWLVIAQKRLAEAGVSAPLVCACAEALPFRAASFDTVVSDSTIEHLRDQAAGLRECERVLRGAGRLFLITPNSRSLGPDPHTGVPAGGWLPDAMTAAYVRRKGGIPPRRRLLSERTLRTLLEDTGFEDVQIEAPDVPAEQRAGFARMTRFGIDAYHFVKRLPGGASLMRAVGPLLQGIARKPDSAKGDHTKRPDRVRNRDGTGDSLGRSEKASAWQ